MQAQLYQKGIVFLSPHFSNFTDKQLADALIAAQRLLIDLQKEQAHRVAQEDLDELRKGKP